MMPSDQDSRPNPTVPPVNQAGPPINQVGPPVNPPNFLILETSYTPLGTFAVPAVSTPTTRNLPDLRRSDYTGLPLGRQGPRRHQLLARLTRGTVSEESEGEEVEVEKEKEESEEEEEMPLDALAQVDYIGKIAIQSPLPKEEPIEAETPDPMNPDELNAHVYAEKARQEAQLIADLVDKGPFYGKPGAEKLKHKLRSEFRILNSIHHYEPIKMLKYVKTSNIYFYSGVRHAALKYERRLFSFFQSYHNHAEDKSDVIKIEVDLVLDDGATWVKVIARSARGLAQECVTGGSGRSRPLLAQAESWLDIAQHYQHLYRPPSIIFHFVQGCPDYMKIKLNNLGVKVETPKVYPLKNYVTLPPDFEEPVATSNVRMDFRESFPVIPDPQGDYKCVNLDIPAVFALISAITNGGENYYYQSQMLNTQATQERQCGVKKFVEAKMKDRKVIMCKTAYNALVAIMKTVAGPKEYERVKLLLRNVKIVPDQPSARIKALAPSERINERAKIIFGTGDFHEAVTITSNVHFVRAAANQGIRLSVFLHEPRALGEMKQGTKIPPPRCIAPGFEEGLKPLVEPLDK
uniref:DUF1308 domain-containing protein n=1 Tax=Steinernema glaseri TaxID=37863 RepID=A0A1I7ZII5_9BILA